jgi:hypothetical protein
MAGTTVKSRLTLGVSGSVSRHGVIEHNKLVDDVARLLPSSVQSTVVGNVGAGVDNLMSYTLPADALNAAGNYVRIRGGGVTANNATAKNLLLKFGAASLLGTLALTASQVGKWYVEAVVVRTGSDTQDYVAVVTEGVGTTLAAGKQAVLFGTATEDEDATVSIQFQGEGGADNDVTQEWMEVTVGRVASDLTAAQIGDDSGTAYTA